MGFSLKRALAGAVVGGAHAAGEVFDAQLKEAALERERQQQFERQKELQTHQADLLMDRENRRDELKAARADKEQEKIGKNMSEIRAAVREKGLDPDKIDGLRYAAGLADEKGYTSIADKYRQRLETERSHTANEENKKLQLAAIAEARAARIEARGRDNEGKNYEKFEKLVLNQLDKDFAVSVLNPHKDDGSTVTDVSAVPSMRQHALDLYSSGMKPDQISKEMNKLQDIMLNERALDPKLPGLKALELGQQRIATDLSARKADKDFAAGVVGQNPASGNAQFSTQGLLKKFEVPVAPQFPSRAARSGQASMPSSSSMFGAGVKTWF